MKDLHLPEAPSPFKVPQELVDARLIQTFKTWRELSRARFAPTRKEIAPARFKSVLSSMFVIEVVDAGADFRLVLAGDTVIRFLGSEFKPGTVLSAVSPSPFRERSFRLFRECVESRAPVGLGPVRTLHDEHNYFDNEAVVLPLSDDGVSVTGILGAICLTPATVPSAAEHR